MRSFILFITLFLLFVSCQEETKNEVNGRLLDPVETEAYNIHLKDFEEPRYKWAYMNESGEEIIKADFDHCRDFINGLAAVNKKGAWGFIDKNGKNVIPCQWKSVRPFSEGLAVVEHFDEQYSYIDKTGKVLFTFPFTKAFSFYNDLARVQTDKGYGYIDKNGKMIIPDQYYKAFDFEDSYTIVKNYDQWEIIDHKGEVLKSIKCDRIYSESEGIIRYKKDKKYGFLSVKDWAFLPFGEFESATDFKNGSSIVRIAGKNNFLFTDGRLKPLEYSFVEYAGSDRWMVEKDGKFGMIDYKTDIVIPIQYDMFYHFEEGICCYQVDELWGFMDMNGEIIKPPFTTLIWAYKNGYARAIVDQAVVFLNKKGEIAFPRKFYEVRDFNEGLARVEIYR